MNLGRPCLPGLVILCVAANLAAETPADPTIDAPTRRNREIRELHQELRLISDSLKEMDAEGSAPASSNSPLTPAVTASSSGAPGLPCIAELPAVLTSADTPALSSLHGTTLNFTLDGYYGSDFNTPIGRVHLLRGYDVTSNSSNLNQVDLILEHLPPPRAALVVGSRRHTVAILRRSAQTTATFRLTYGWGMLQLSW